MLSLSPSGLVSKCFIARQFGKLQLKLSLCDFFLVLATF